MFTWCWLVASDLLYLIKYCNDMSSGVVCLTLDKEHFPVGSEESNTLYSKLFPRNISWIKKKVNVLANEFCL
jgi:hypothetical protein